jgi:hypothetical protein
MIGHTKADIRRFQLLNQLGCCVCMEFYGAPSTPGDIHHIEGKSKKGSHQKTICLCPYHHRIPWPKEVDSTGVSLCEGKKLFTDRYMSESELLLLTNKKLSELEQNFI